MFGGVDNDIQVEDDENEEAVASIADILNKHKSQQRRQSNPYTMNSDVGSGLKKLTNKAAQFESQRLTLNTQEIRLQANRPDSSMQVYSPSKRVSFMEHLPLGDRNRLESPTLVPKYQPNIGSPTNRRRSILKRGSIIGDES